MSSSITPVHNAEIQRMDQSKKDLLKRTFCKNATDDEFELFLHACERTKLDPFMKQIYAIKRKDQMTIQTGIDGYRLIAERTGKYVPGKECSFTYKNERLHSATAYIKKMSADGAWHEISYTAFFDEYAQKNYNGGYSGLWATGPHIMLSKCAEACCLRKAFPADLSGIYTKEEMEQADNSTIETVPVTEVSKTSDESLIPEEIGDTLEKQIKEYIEDSDAAYLKRMLDYYSKQEGREIKKISQIPSKYLPFISFKINTASTEIQKSTKSKVS